MSAPAADMTGFALVSVSPQCSNRGMHDDPSILRVGRLAAAGVAVTYIAASICATLMPPELQGRPEISAHEFWLVLSRQPWAHLTFHWIWVANGFFGMAAVPALSARVWPLHRGAVLWASLAAWYGFAVQARSHLMEVAFDRKVIPLYAEATPAFQEAVQVVAGLALDIPDGFLTYGAIGVWVATLSWLAGHHGLWPASLRLLGLAAATCYLAGLLGYTFLIRPLLVLSFAPGSVLLIPAWYLTAARWMCRPVIVR